MVSLFAASFYLSWLLFAVLYYIVCYLHGDLLPGKISTSHYGSLDYPFTPPLFPGGY
jgi:hypothetical protein